MEQYKALWEADRERAAAKKDTGSAVRYDAFHPGQVWLDTGGQPIQAHGGQVFYEDGTWYWYGENKEHTDTKTGIWSWGIRCYRSVDLYNWEDLGLIIPPDLEHPDAGLFPDKHVDRPHITKSGATGKYVCWIKLSGVSGSFIVLEAEKITGPYSILREDYRPFDMEVGDFDLYTDLKSGKTYLFESADHNEVVGMELSPDCTEAVRIVSRQYGGLIPPFTREGITLFDAEGRYRMITSGMTGYLPNQSDSAVTDDLETPFERTGDPHVGDETHTSFHSQLSQVFRVPGTDLLIAVADRWVIDPLLDEKQEDMLVRVIGGTKDPEHYKAAPEETAVIMSMPAMDDTKVNTSLARYVWLPVIMENNKPVIRWKDVWSV